jgi:hypothetical protein
VNKNKLTGNSKLSSDWLTGWVSTFGAVEVGLSSLQQEYLMLDLRFTQQ